MAEGKKAVLLYVDTIHTVEQLDDSTAGQLFKHYLRYVNDQDPETDNILVKIAFEPIKHQLKRDLNKWETKKEGSSNNGRLGNLKRYNPDIYDLVLGGKMSLEEGENLAKSRKVSGGDDGDRGRSGDVANLAVTVTDTVNVIVTDNVIQDINPLSAEADVSKEVIDFEALKKFWNDKATKAGLPLIINMSDDRKKNVRTIVNKFGKKSLIQAIENCFNTPHCLGDNDRGWRADFDFVLQKKSFNRLIEGSYQNKEKGPAKVTVTINKDPKKYL